ncbi:MAG: DUF6544 family protein [Caldilineaceae bacterium]
MKTLLIFGCSLIFLALLGWVGLKIKPAPFPAFPQPTPPFAMIPLPAGLPAPVERFFRLVYGEEAPVITSAVLTGRATMRPFGPLALPARFRFTHDAGKGYHHYIEATWFGIPIMKVNEHFLEGQGRLELPFGVEEGDKIDQGATLGLWSESLWLPAIYLTAPGVRWEPVDEVTALLVVPFNDAEERYVVRFDPANGLPTWFESMRYHGQSSTDKVLWLNHLVEWEMHSGKPALKTGTAIWMDDGKPWAVFTVEEAVFNVDIREYIRTKGQ